MTEPTALNPLAYPACMRVPLPPHGYAAYVLSLDQRQGFRSEQVMAPTEEQERELTAMADRVADRPFEGPPPAEQNKLLGLDGRPMGAQDRPRIVVPRPVVR